MKNKVVLPFLIITFASLVAGVLLFILPAVTHMYKGTMTYNTEQAAQATNYPNVTTPLSQEAVTDLCKKFEINSDDKRCQLGAVVYGPDFFTDIKLYLYDFPENESTFELVESKLGSYLVKCEQPTKDGNYRCRYDLRGDGRYPIFVLFNEEGLYYQIIAHTQGGS
ncbi:MAG: hypothetical protein U0X92_09210 [Anaerolineales bacterium]